MSFLNPNLASEVIYGSSGDVRGEINAYLLVSTAGHYADDKEIPGDLIVKSMVRATRLINTFLKPVYADQVPFTTVAAVPLYLETVSEDIAMYYVWRSVSVLLGNMPDQKKRDYFEQYINSKDGILVMISQGKMSIPELAATTPDEAKEARQQSRTPIFDLDDIKNQQVDPDLLQDIADARAT